MGRYVFISYSHKDSDLAESIRSDLAQKDVECWMAPFDLCDSQYEKTVPQVIENCACLLLIYSKNSQKSPWVEKEVEKAISYKKPVIPLQVNDFEMSSSYSYLLTNAEIKRVRTMNFSDPNYVDAIYKIVRTVREDLSPENIELLQQQLENDKVRQSLIDLVEKKYPITLLVGFVLPFIITLLSYFLNWSIWSWMQWAIGAYSIFSYFATAYLIYTSHPIAKKNIGDLYGVITTISVIGSLVCFYFLKDYYLVPFIFSCGSYVIFSVFSFYFLSLKKKYYSLIIGGSLVLVIISMILLLIYN